MKRATATALVLALAASATSAGAQTVLWGGSSSPASPSGGSPVYNGPIYNPQPTTPTLPGYGGGLAPPTPTTTPPGYGGGLTPIPTPVPSVVRPGPIPPVPAPVATQPRPGASGGLISAPDPTYQNWGGGGGPGGGASRWGEPEPQYGEWRNDEAERAQELVQNLERLLRAAERQRAADPDFLRDLRRLVDRYEGRGDFRRDGRDGRGNDRPGTRPVPRPDVSVVQPPQPPAPPPAPALRSYLEDTFADGDFTRGVIWTPRQGQWRVDPQNGLRSVRPAAPPVTRRQVSPQELLQALLVGPQSIGLGAQEAPPNAALIEYAQPIGNAFTLKARVTDHSAGEGAAHLIMHQGGVNWNGYRLELRGGPEGRAVLTRRGASGYTDLANAPLRRFAPNVQHDVEWTRAPNGAMTVAVDGETLFSVTDMGFRDNWAGFAFFNAGGDFSLRAVSVQERR